MTETQTRSFLIRIHVKELRELGYSPKEILNLDSLAHNEKFSWEILKAKSIDVATKSPAFRKYFKLP